MKHYKDEQNNIYAYECDGSQDIYIKTGLTILTDAELLALRQPTAQQIKDAENAKVFAELDDIDIKCIRAVREYIASKGDSPQILKDRETLAAQLRAKLK